MLSKVEELKAKIENLKYERDTNIDAVQCLHQRIELGKYKQSHGQYRVRNFCSDCGQSLSSDLKMASIDLSKLREFNNCYETSNRKTVSVIASQYRAEIVQLEQELNREKFTPRDVIESDEDALEDKQDFWDRYTPYLRSQRWHTMRTLVLKRDENICQSCLSRKATQVHHLSYRLFKQIGYSAAFELVAICYECHNKIHPHMAHAQHEMLSGLYNPYLTGVTRER